jgi:hypothetical protein
MVIGLLVMGGADGLLAEVFVLAMMGVGDVDSSLRDEFKEAVGGKGGLLWNAEHVGPYAS